MRINHNLMAMNTQRQLGINAGNGAKSIEKLSSGYRINRAGDDAAGLAISEKMRAQVRGLNQASRNAQDAISLVQTAEGALGETQAILQRMRELANQAANDTNVDQDRSEIQKEINQLTSEINRIGNTTEFNTQKLLNGGSGKTGSVRYSVDTEGVSEVPPTGDLSAANEVTASVKAGTAAVSGVTVNQTSTVGVAATGSTTAPVETTPSVVKGTGAIQLQRNEVSSVAAADAGSVDTSFNVDTASVTAGTIAANRDEIVAGAAGATATYGLELTANATAGDTIELFNTTFTFTATGAGANEFKVGDTIQDTVDNMFAKLDGFGGAGANQATFNGVTYNLDDNDPSYKSGGYADNNIIVFTNAAGNGADAANSTEFTANDAETPVVAQAGVYQFEVASNFEAGQTIKIGDVELTAVTGAPADATKEFQIGADNDATATNIIASLDAIGAAGGKGANTTIINGQDYSTAQVAGGINSDTIQLTEVAASGTDLTTPTTTNVAEVQGVDSFEMKTQFSVGDKIEIGGVTFTAVADAGGAGNTATTFEVGTDLNDATADLAAAINLSSLNTDLTAATVAGSNGNNKITLTEKVGQADGANLAAITVTQLPEQAGVSDMTVLTQFTAGEKITIDGEEFTAVASGATGNQFNIGADTDATAANLKTAIEGNATLNAHYTMAVAGSKLTFTEKAGQADGSAAPTVSAVSGVGEQLGEFEFEITANPSIGDKITVDGVELEGAAAAGAGKYEVGATLEETVDNIVSAINADATLSVQYTASKEADMTDPLNPSYSIKLNEKAGKADGDATIAVSASPVVEVQGVYTIDVDTNFAAGDKVEIDGTTLTAGDANTATTFKVGADKDATAANLKAAMDLSGLSTRFTMAQSGNSISLTEKAGQATGVALADPIEKGAATQGEFTFSTQALSTGSSITIDDQKLTFVTGGDESQTAAELKTLIEGNATLNDAYSVAVDGAEVTLTQKAGKESSDQPILSYEVVAGAGFNATMQIGANTGQSTAIEIGDVRADSLGVSSETAPNDQTVEVDGKQYKVAWTADKTVTNGTENVGAENALDVSNHDNATAAVEVINNAINSVSTERAKLGAIQNRLEHTIKNLDTSSENLVAAESRIRDVDMAKEMMEFTKNNILQQAAQSMLAQANQAPQGVLQLLR